MDKEKPKAIGDILTNVLQSIGVYENYLILSKWEEIVGKEIAFVTEPMLMKDDSLEVRVKNTIWKMELEGMSDKIMKEINAFLRKKTVKKIVFKIGLRRRQI